jgi:hypothetical protein
MPEQQMTYTVPNFPSTKARMIGRDQTVQEVISLIAMMDNADIDQLVLNDMQLPPDESFDDFYQSKDQLFVFSKASATQVTSPSATPLPPPAPPKQGKQFPPSVKKGKLHRSDGSKISGMYDIPDGIIAHLTRECGGNVHERQIVKVTSGSFEKVTVGANPHSGAFDNNPKYAAKNAADLESVSNFLSAYRSSSQDIPHTQNNWVC